MNEPDLSAIVYELLDAHQDTVELAGSHTDDCWQAHLDYLRALQRRGREALARAAASDQPSQESPR